MTLIKLGAGYQFGVNDPVAEGKLGEVLGAGTGYGELVVRGVRIPQGAFLLQHAIIVGHKSENSQPSKSFHWAGFQLEASQITGLELLVAEEPDVPTRLAFTNLHKAWPNMTALDNEK